MSNIKNVYKGFYSNRVNFEREELHTAMNGEFQNGFTYMNINNLRKGVQGANKALDVVLNELLDHKEALESGKTVNVILEWELTEDRMEYKWVKPLGVEVEETE